MSSIIQHVIRNNVHLAHSWHQIILVFLAAITVTVVQVMMNAWNVEVDMNLMVQNAYNHAKWENIEIIMEIVTHAQPNVLLVTLKINVPAAFQDIYFKVMIA